VKSDTGIAPDGRRYGRRRCRLARKKWDTAIADFDPDFVLVLVGGAGVAYREGKTLDPCDPDYQRVFYQDLREAISRLGKGGATVALTTTAHHVNFGGVEESRRKIQCLNAIRTRVAEETSAELIDLYQWTCPEQKCVELTGNTPLRSDGVHYRGAGADATSAWLLDQLAIRGTGE
jgi:lysophospholipase L1-like esterase